MLVPLTLRGVHPFTARPFEGKAGDGTLLDVLTPKGVGDLARGMQPRKLSRQHFGAHRARAGRADSYRGRLVRGLAVRR